MWIDSEQVLSAEVFRRWCTLIYVWGENFLRILLQGGRTYTEIQLIYSSILIKIKINATVYSLIYFTGFAVK